MRRLTPEEKVPQKLQETLDAAFAKAFTLIFQKGSHVKKLIEKKSLKKTIRFRNMHISFVKTESH